MGKMREPDFFGGAGAQISSAVVLLTYVRASHYVRQDEKTTAKKIREKKSPLSLQQLQLPTRKMYCMALGLDSCGAICDSM